MDVAMYKIYINDSPLYLLKRDLLNEVMKEEPDGLVIEYQNKPRNLFNYIDLLEKSEERKVVIFHAKDFDQLVNEFAALYKIVEAAGGLVFNNLNQLLVIFRRGRWDLPKGKMESGETKEQTAEREVMEETGITTLTLGRYIDRTYHTYRNRKGIRCIKKSYWYEMNTDDMVLKPEIEEDIEEANWVEVKPFLNNEKLIYPNIRDIIEDYLLLN